MLVKELKQLLKHAQDEERVVIQVEPEPLSIGGIPCVDVEFAGSGYDWNSGHFILTPETKLRKMTEEDKKREKQEICKIVKKLKKSERKR